MLHKETSSKNSEKSKKVNFSIELSSISRDDELDTINYNNNNNTTSNIHHKENIHINNNNSNCNKHSSSLNIPFKSTKILNHFDHLNANYSNKTKFFLSNKSKFLFETNNISLNSPIFANRLNHQKLSNQDQVSLITPLPLLLSNQATSAQNRSKRKKGFVHREGGYGWIVVFASCWCFGFIIAVSNSYSLIYNSLVDNYRNVTNNVVYAG
jgi:hypothetical protein